MKKILSVWVLSALLGTAWANTASVPASAPAMGQSVGSQTVQVTPNLTPVPEIKATAYLVQDLQSNQILAVKGLTQPIEPASLTKLMTAYLTFKALEEKKLQPEQMLSASERAWKVEGSRMFLEMSKPVTVSDLVKGLIVVSANDAAITLAESIAGSEEAFVILMNAEAKRLGMHNTHFENAVGFSDKTHLTTVQDLMILSKAIMRDFPQYYELYSRKEFTYNNITQPNTNLLLFRDPSVDGLKTGHTNSAGYNLIASSKRDGRRVVSVLIGASSKEARATESSKLLNYALTAFDTHKMFQAGQGLEQVKVYKGAEDTVAVGFLHDAYVTVPHGKGQQIKSILETTQPVLAPIQKGQVLGVVKLLDGERVLVEQPVVALQDVGEAGWFGRIWDSIKLWFMGLFSNE